MSVPPLGAEFETRYEAELEALSDRELTFLKWSLGWRDSARGKQLPPDDITDPKTGLVKPWFTWVISTGRGYGKTLTGAHWILECAGTEPGSFNGIIAPTLDDVRFTCMEGATGLLSPAFVDPDTGAISGGVGFPENLIDDYNKTHHILTLWNGAVIRGFGSERPNKLRGPQHHKVWGDEVSSWVKALDTFNMMKFGLRLGKHPQFLATTTPKPNKIMKRLLADKNSVVTRGSSYENRANLSEVYWGEIAQYEGTKLGRQELDGELLSDEEDGIIESKWIKRWPHDKPLPKFNLILASLDTAFTERDLDKQTRAPDRTVMQVWGVFVIATEFHVMLLDSWRDWLNFPSLVARVKDELQRTYGDADEPVFKPLIATPADTLSRTSHTAGHQGRKSDVVLIEDKGSGISLRQQLAAENILAFPYNPGRADKLLRLHLVSPLFAAGRVWMVASGKLETYVPGELPPVRTWAEPVREALCTFKGEGSIEFDDDVDAATQALKYVKDRFMKSFTKPGGSNDHEAKRERGSAAVVQSNPYAQ